LNTPNRIPGQDLGVSASSFSQGANIVVQELQDAGYEAYLVGGCVRDVSTSASPEEVRDIFRNSRIIGRRFRITHVRLKGKVKKVS